MNAIGNKEENTTKNQHKTNLLGYSVLLWESSCRWIGGGGLVRWRRAEGDCTRPLNLSQVRLRGIYRRIPQTRTSQLVTVSFTHCTDGRVFIETNTRGEGGRDSVLYSQPTGAIFRACTNYRVNHFSDEIYVRLAFSKKKYEC